MDDNELRPCWRCNGTNILLFNVDDEMTRRVVCCSCGASGPVCIDDNRAIRAWNQRDTEDQLRAEIAAAREQLAQLLQMAAENQAYHDDFVSGREAGMKARLEYNATEDDNPYPPESEESKHKGWYRGWEEMDNHLMRKKAETELASARADAERFSIAASHFVDGKNDDWMNEIIAALIEHREEAKKNNMSTQEAE